MNSDIRLTKSEFAVLKALDDEGPNAVEGVSFSQVVSSSNQPRYEALEILKKLLGLEFARHEGELDGVRFWITQRGEAWMRAYRRGLLVVTT